MNRNRQIPVNPRSYHIDKDRSVVRGQVFSEQSAIDVAGGLVRMKSVCEKSGRLGLIECILILRKPMWQVGIVPAKLSDAIGSLVRYAQESLNVFFCPT